MMRAAPGTRDSGETVFEHFLGGLSLDGMMDTRMMTDVQPPSVPQRLGSTCQGLLAGSLSGIRTLFQC